MKKCSTVLCTAALLLCVSGCGQSKKDVSIDISALASELLTSVTSDELAETAKEIIPQIYFYEEDTVADAIAYASSGATACEIAVIQSTDAKNTSEIEELLQDRVDTQSSVYASYNEGEVTKLDQAIIESTGTYTVLCVCDDTDTAKEILEKYGF